MMTGKMRMAALLGLACLAPAVGSAAGMMGNVSPRQAYFARQGVPPEYARMANPAPASAANIGAGKQLYEQYCAVCHGAKGRGDGDGAVTLVPRPADLSATVRTPMASDGYLYWSIAEGGAAFNTAMPSMKDALKPAEIWNVILYLRTL